MSDIYFTACVFVTIPTNPKGLDRINDCAQRPSHTTHKTAKLFIKQLLWKPFPTYKTVKKNFVVKKNCSVYER